MQTVFATDIVLFQDPTVIVLNGTGDDTAMDRKNSTIDTFHGKISQWALMWWLISSAAVTTIVLGSSIWYRKHEKAKNDREAGGAQSATNKRFFGHNTKKLLSDGCSGATTTGFPKATKEGLRWIIHADTSGKNDSGKTTS